MIFPDNFGAKFCGFLEAMITGRCSFEILTLEETTLTSGRLTPLLLLKIVIGPLPFGIAFVITAFSFKSRLLALV